MKKVDEFMSPIEMDDTDNEPTVGNLLKYTEFLAEKLDQTLNYIEYLGENLENAMSRIRSLECPSIKKRIDAVIFPKYGKECAYIADTIGVTLCEHHGDNISEQHVSDVDNDIKALGYDTYRVVSESGKTISIFIK